MQRELLASDVKDQEAKSICGAEKMLNILVWTGESQLGGLRDECLQNQGFFPSAVRGNTTQQKRTCRKLSTLQPNAKCPQLLLHGPCRPFTTPCPSSGCSQRASDPSDTLGFVFYCSLFYNHFSSIVPFTFSIACIHIPGKILIIFTCIYFPGTSIDWIPPNSGFIPQQ